MGEPKILSTYRQSRITWVTLTLAKVKLMPPFKRAKTFTKGSTPKQSMIRLLEDRKISILSGSVYRLPEDSTFPTQRDVQTSIAGEITVDELKMPFISVLL